MMASPVQTPSVWLLVPVLIIAKDRGVHGLAKFDLNATFILYANLEQNIKFGMALYSQIFAKFNSFNVKILQTANCMINYLFRIFNYS